MARRAVNRNALDWERDAKDRKYYYQTKGLGIFKLADKCRSRNCAIAEDILVTAALLTKC
jgi:hypothetical protein